MLPTYIIHIYYRLKTLCVSSQTPIIYISQVMSNCFILYRRQEANPNEEIDFGPNTFRSSV